MKHCISWFRLLYFSSQDTYNTLFHTNYTNEEYRNGSDVGIRRYESMSISDFYAISNTDIRSNYLTFYTFKEYIE